MALTPGTRLGPYEILSAIGAGGMGEVYKARDTRLDRTVAIKILPEAFAADSDRVARFQREAKTLAALNHPNIAQIFGLEQAGDVHALAMELVAGEDLSERIARGAIPIDEVVPIAKQIAEALEAAHEQGIIHRDLKPANIKVTPDGRVKVLDFGLAKLSDVSDIQISGELSHSPTLTAVGTLHGMILGTAAYMSPEQARGRPVDKRTDLWSFGCVLYEMFTGAKAFDGEDATETIAAVVKTTPAWASLPRDVPLHIVTLIQRCLEKDRKGRIGDIAVARFLLDGDPTLGSPARPAHPQPALASIWRRAMPWASSLLIVAVLTGVVVFWKPWRAPRVRVAKLSVLPPNGEGVAIDNNNADVAISADGSQIVFATGFQPEYRWYVRSINTLAPRLLGTLPPDAENPFFSPDGAWIGFSDELAIPRKLLKLRMTGGTPMTICEIPEGTGNVRGAAWGPDGTIVFATSTSPGGLWRVSADGGKPEPLTQPAPSTRHVWPSFLPGGGGVLYTIVPNSGIGGSQIAVFNLATRVQSVLASGTYARYAPSGHLLFGVNGQAGALHALRFDERRLTAMGNPVPVIEGVVTKGSGLADFDVGSDGTLVYVAGNNSAGNSRTLVWVDRQGQEELTGVPPKGYVYARLSPDGTRVALDARDTAGGDIWIWNIIQKTLDLLTSNDPSLNRMPVWTPDSTKVAYTSSPTGMVEGIYWRPADGSGIPQRISAASTTFPHGPQSFSPDGKSLVFTTPLEGGSQIDLWLLKLDPEPHAEKLLATPVSEHNGVISPDGHWLAYESTESGRAQVYVRPFPNVDASKTTISTTGGTRPLWSHDGNELFYYVEPGTIMSASIRNGTRLSTPSVVVRGQFPSPSNNARHYDVSTDGKKFLLLKDTGKPDPSGNQLVMALNWLEELKPIGGTVESPR